MLVDLLLDLPLVAKKLVMGQGACATFSIAPSFPAAFAPIYGLFRTGIAAS